MSSIYNNIINLLQDHGISYEEYDHDPVLNYEDAEREKLKFGWTGIESKNVFMKGNDGKYYLYVTVQGERVDFKKLKKNFGIKMSIANEDDVKNIINCVPGCVAPFGFSSEIIVIIDTSIFKHTDYLFSPGVTTKTICANIQDLKKIFDAMPNKKIELC